MVGAKRIELFTIRCRRIVIPINYAPIEISTVTDVTRLILLNGLHTHESQRNMLAAVTVKLRCCSDKP